MDPRPPLPLPLPPDHPVAVALADLVAQIDRFDDLDESMSAQDVAAHPVTRFARALHEHDPAALRWLAYFCARRALPCWEVIVPENPRPRETVERIGRLLRDGSAAAVAAAAADLRAASKPTPSPFDDCFYSQTQCAADAVAECARYLATGDPVRAAHCFGAADCAYTHAFTGDEFRRWAVEVAVPAALERREMTPAEQDALRAPRTPRPG